MHGNDVHEAHYKIWEIHFHGQGLGRVKNGHIEQMYKILKSIHPYSHSSVK